MPKTLSYLIKSQVEGMKDFWFKDEEDMVYLEVVTERKWDQSQGTVEGTWAEMWAHWGCVFGRRESLMKEEVIIWAETGRMRRVLQVKRRMKHSSQRQLYVQWLGAEKGLAPLWMASSSVWRRLAVVLGRGGGQGEGRVLRLSGGMELEYKTNVWFTRLPGKELLLLFKHPRGVKEVRSSLSACDDTFINGLLFYFLIALIRMLGKELWGAILIEPGIIWRILAYLDLSNKVL